MVRVACFSCSLVAVLSFHVLVSLFRVLIDSPTMCVKHTGHFVSLWSVDPRVSSGCLTAKWRHKLAALVPLKGHPTLRHVVVVLDMLWYWGCSVVVVVAAV